MLEKASQIRLPDKIYFRIGEVSEYTGIKPYVLRYWESEFDEINPIRRKSQRLYDRETIYTIIKIKDMLYEQSYTIAGAKKKLREENQGNSQSEEKEFLRELLSELKTIRKLLE